MDYVNALAIITNFILLPGLTYGSQLALGAMGVTLIYAVLRFSNFAHGEIMSLAQWFVSYLPGLARAMGYPWDFYLQQSCLYQWLWSLQFFTVC